MNKTSRMKKITHKKNKQFIQHKKHTQHKQHKKHKKHIKSKIPQNIINDEKQFCNNTRQYLQRIVPHNIFNSYNIYASALTDKFILNNKTILDTIFNIKDSYRYQNMSLGAQKYKLLISKPIILKNTHQDNSPETQHYNIPPFIDIIKYLFSVDIFNKHFTADELADIMPILNKYKYTKHTTTNAHIVYDYLENNKIGYKIGYKICDVYYKEFNNLNLYVKFPSLKIHNLLINSFTSYNLLENIEKHMNTLTTCTLLPREHIQSQSQQPINNTIPFLYIYSDNHDNNDNNDNHDNNDNNDNNNNDHKAQYQSELITSIIERVLFFNELLGGSIRLPDKLITYLTNETKQIDNNLELGHVPHFKTININSAVTNSRDIIIYRKQELLKSIFHELIHFHELDFRINNTNTKHIDIILKYLKSTHNISANNEYLLYECITEALENILNNIYSITGTPQETPETPENNKYNKFHNNYVNELIFSIFQVAKILKLCKYSSWEEFVLLEKKPRHQPSTHTHYNNNANYTHNINKQFIQDSCVFSYYILKLYILLNIDEYFTTILDNKLKFQPTLTNFNKLINIFEQGRTNKYLANMINAILDNTENGINGKKHKTKKQNNSIYNTLRMTCIPSTT